MLVHGSFGGLTLWAFSWRMFILSLFVIDSLAFPEFASPNVTFNYSKSVINNNKTENRDRNNGQKTIQTRTIIRTPYRFPPSIFKRQPFRAPDRKINEQTSLRPNNIDAKNDQQSNSTMMNHRILARAPDHFDNWSNKTCDELRYQNHNYDFVDKLKFENHANLAENVGTRIRRHDKVFEKGATNETVPRTVPANETKTVEIDKNNAFPEEVERSRSSAEPLQTSADSSASSSLYYFSPPSAEPSSPPLSLPNNHRHHHPSPPPSHHRLSYPALLPQPSSYPSYPPTPYPATNPGPASYSVNAIICNFSLWHYNFANDHYRDSLFTYGYNHHFHTKLWFIKTAEDYHHHHHQSQNAEYLDDYSIQNYDNSIGDSPPSYNPNAQPRIGWGRLLSPIYSNPLNIPPYNRSALDTDFCILIEFQFDSRGMDQLTLLLQDDDGVKTLLSYIHDRKNHTEGLLLRKYIHFRMGSRARFLFEFRFRTLYHNNQYGLRQFELHFNDCPKPGNILEAEHILAPENIQIPESVLTPDSYKDSMQVSYIQMPSNNQNPLKQQIELDYSNVQPPIYQLSLSAETHYPDAIPTKISYIDRNPYGIEKSLTESPIEYAHDPKSYINYFDEQNRMDLINEFRNYQFQGQNSNFRYPGFQNFKAISDNSQGQRLIQQRPGKHQNQAIQQANYLIGKVQQPPPIYNQQQYQKPIYPGSFLRESEQYLNMNQLNNPIPIPIPQYSKQIEKSPLSHPASKVHIKLLPSPSENLPTYQNPPNITIPKQHSNVNPDAESLYWFQS